MILLDPKTGHPLGPIDGTPVRARPDTPRWVIERDAAGVPVRMRWVEGWRADIEAANGRETRP